MKPKVTRIKVSNCSVCPFAMNQMKHFIFEAGEAKGNQLTAGTCGITPWVFCVDELYAGCPLIKEPLMFYAEKERE
jgi:hypothetical protein